jgi:hypothetical protein
MVTEKKTGKIREERASGHLEAFRKHKESLRKFLTLQIFHPDNLIA